MFDEILPHLSLCERLETATQLFQFFLRLWSLYVFEMLFLDHYEPFIALILMKLIDDIEAFLTSSGSLGHLPLFQKILLGFRFS